MVLKAAILLSASFPRWKTVCTAALGLGVLWPTLTFGSGINPYEIYQFEPCYRFQLQDPKDKTKLTPPRYSEYDLAAFRDPTRFPAWGTDLGYLNKAVERLNKSVINESCDVRMPGKLPKLAHLKSIANVTRNLTDLIVRDLEAQRNSAQQIKTCLDALGPNLKNPSTAFLESAFVGVSTDPERAKCARLTNFVIANLRERQKKLRFYLALKSGDPGAAQLEHDLPYSTMLTQLVYPSQRTFVQNVPGLSAAEKAELAEFSKNLPQGKSPAFLYDQMLSTTPVLLKFRDEVDAPSLHQALAELIAHQNLEYKNFQNRVGQEIFLQTPYVAKAIAQLPETEQELACRSTVGVFLALKTKHEKVPQFTAIVALALSVPTSAFAVGAVVGKGALGQFLKRGAIGATAVSVVHGSNLFRRYQNGVEFCASVFRQKNPDPDVDGLCSFAKTRKIQEEMELTAITNLAFLGAARMASPVADIYRKVIKSSE